MRLNLPAITFILACAGLSLGAIATSSTLWANGVQSSITTQVEEWQTAQVTLTD